MTNQQWAPEALANFDAAVAAVLQCVGTAPCNSHEICTGFAANTRKRLAALLEAQQPTPSAAAAPDETTAMNRTRELAESGRWPSDWVEAYRRGYSDRAARKQGDTMTEPTDAELWQFYMTLPGATPTSQPDPIEIMRATLAKWGTPPVAKWAPEEIADGERGIRWVTNEGIHGRPTDHDVREYLKRTPTAHGCHCDECKQFYTTQQPTQAQTQGG